MEEFLSADSISLVSVSPLQAFELRKEDPGIPTRLKNEEKKCSKARCVLMAALQDHKDELNRIKKSEEGAFDLLDEFGCSAIHYAARHNNPRVISMLLDVGADINLKGPGGQTALYITARFNNVEAAKVLIDNNADTTIPSDDNSIPLHAASRHGYQDIVKLLLESNPSVVNCKCMGYMTPLSLASLKDISNVIEVLLYSTTLIYIAPYFASKPLYYSPGVQWNAGVLALFMCYTDLLLYIRRVGNSGIYVAMFFEVFFTFLNVLAVFVVVIFGSCVIFYVLLKEEDNFSSIPLSFVKTSVMMVGELDYSDILTDNVVNKNTNPSTGAPYVPLPEITYTVFYFFMLGVPVLLMNLLVGLAVGDIDAIQKTASFSRLKDQAKFVEDTQKRYPRQLRRMLYKDNLVIFPNSNKLFKSMLLAGTSIIDTEYIEELCQLKAANTNDDTIESKETLHYDKQKSKLRLLEAKIDQQNKLLVAIGQKIGINDLDELDSML